jgi:hypothetical protein
MRLQYKINWFGLAGGVTTIVLIAVSLFVPWWQLSIPNSTSDPNISKSPVVANVSPLYTNFDLIGNSFTVPLVFAINLSCILLSLAGGVIMLIYSVKPTKPYAKRLLGFSYRTPLLFVIVFLIGLIALSLIIQGLFSFSVPLFGSSEVKLPSTATPQGTNVSVLLSAGFLWPFYLAIASAILCIGARLYHRRILPSASTPAPPAVITTIASAAPT